VIDRCALAHSDQAVAPVAVARAPRTVVLDDDYENYYSPICNCDQYGIQNYTTTTAVDHLTSSPATSVREDTHPSWIDNHRTLVWDPYFSYEASTWVPGGDYHNEQWWFQFPDAMLRDGELSPDRTKLVATASTAGLGSAYDHLYVWSTNGAAWTGEPPYNEDINNPPEVPAPTLRCQNVRDSEAVGPTWSPDSRAIAYQDKDGIWLQQIPAELGDCSGMTERLLVAAGSDPDWGPAEVNMAEKPAAPGTPGAGPTGPGWLPTQGQRPASTPITHRLAPVVLHELSISPRAFRAARRGPAIPRRGGARIHFTLSRAATVTLTVARGRTVLGRIAVAGIAGPNAIRFSGRIAGRRLAPGRYQLVASLGSASRGPGSPSPAEPASQIPARSPRA
jgi:hypothetical protein